MNINISNLDNNNLDIRTSEHIDYIKNNLKQTLDNLHNNKGLFLLLFLIYAYPNSVYANDNSFESNNSNHEGLVRIEVTESGEVKSPQEVLLNRLQEAVKTSINDVVGYLRKNGTNKIIFENSKGDYYYKLNDGIVVLNYYERSSVEEKDVFLKNWLISETDKIFEKTINKYSQNGYSEEIFGEVLQKQYNIITSFSNQQDLIDFLKIRLGSSFKEKEYTSDTLYVNIDNYFNNLRKTTQNYIENNKSNEYILSKLDLENL